jgi:hypothetical protein
MYRFSWVFFILNAFLTISFVSSSVLGEIGGGLLGLRKHMPKRSLSANSTTIYKYLSTFSKHSVLLDGFGNGDLSFLLIGAKCSRICEFRKDRDIFNYLFHLVFCDFMTRCDHMRKYTSSFYI